MNKLKVMDLLFAKIPFVKEYNGLVRVYGNAAKKFGRWE
jgi:hypothetical protein